jgi:hypothetical protein
LYRFSLDQSALLSIRRFWSASLFELRKLPGTCISARSDLEKHRSSEFSQQSKPAICALCRTWETRQTGFDSNGAEHIDRK